MVLASKIGYMLVVRHCVTLSYIIPFYHSADLTSPKFRPQNYPFLKGADVVRMIEEDELSILSDSSSCSNVTTITISSTSSRRSTRSTPVRDVLPDDVRQSSTPTKYVVKGVSNTPTKPTVNYAVKGQSSTPSKARTPSKVNPNKSSPSESISPNKYVIKGRSVMSCESVSCSDRAESPRRNRTNVVVSETCRSKTTPKRSQTNLEESDIVLTKRCRTEPKQKCVTMSRESPSKRAPKTEMKLRRVQSVKIKKLGNEYTSFRSNTPDSEGRNMRTRLSDKFTEIKVADDLRRSGRTAFTVVTNTRSPGVAKSPKKVRAAKAR